MEKIKTVIILSEERFRKEYRHLLSKLDFARIELELLNSQEGLGDEAIEEISNFDPELFLVDLPKERSDGLRILNQLHRHFLHIPMVAAGDSYDSMFLIEMMRLGVKEFLPRPASAERLKEACQRIYKSIYSQIREKHPATILSFFGSQGGSGSTSIATNVAVSLSKLSKKKVLIVDLDTELGDVAGFFGVKENKYLIQAVPDKAYLDPRQASGVIINHEKSNVDLLSLSDGNARKYQPSIGEIKTLLNFLQNDYDYILLDTNNMFEDKTVAALDVSHIVFLVSKCSLPALRNAQRVLHVFDKLGYSKTKVRLIVNRYSNTDEIRLKNVEKVLRFDVFWSIPNDFRAIIQSIQAGEPLTQRSRTIPLAKSFYEMTARVLGIQLEKMPRTPGGGLMIPATRSLPITTLNLLKS
jgi:pilus assembly protein CpaE